MASLWQLQHSLQGITKSLGIRTCLHGFSRYVYTSSGPSNPPPPDQPLILIRGVSSYIQILLLGRVCSTHGSSKEKCIVHILVVTPQSTLCRLHYGFMTACFKFSTGYIMLQARMCLGIWLFNASRILHNGASYIVQFSNAIRFLLGRAGGKIWWKLSPDKNFLLVKLTAMLYIDPDSWANCWC